MIILVLKTEMIHNLCRLCGGLIAAVDHGEQRVCSMLGELALNSTGLHGMPIYCEKHTTQSQNNFSIVSNN